MFVNKMESWKIVRLPSGWFILQYSMTSKTKTKTFSRYSAVKLIYTAQLFSPTRPCTTNVVELIPM